MAWEIMDRQPRLARARMEKTIMEKRALTQERRATIETRRRQGQSRGTDTTIETRGTSDQRARGTEPKWCFIGTWMHRLVRTQGTQISRTATQVHRVLREGAPRRPAVSFPASIYRDAFKCRLCSEGEKQQHIYECICFE